MKKNIFNTDYLLDKGKRALFRLNTKIETFIPDNLNSLANTGAIANATFLIALFTGIIVLIWYSPSVHDAHTSVREMMTTYSWSGGIIRSLHRYSSDACMLMVLIHVLELVLLKKFNKTRWLAWVTGVFLLFLLWLEGWIGYWLIWDEGAKYVAIGTAKIVDILPIFAEPLARSFLTAESVNSLFFFVIFFLHMLVPLFMGIFLWIHITRINKANFFTNKKLTIYILLTLIIISIIHPAPFGEAAKMRSLDATFPIDFYFTLPIYIINHLSSGMIWILVLFSVIIFTTIPWWVKKREVTPTKIDLSACGGCKACSTDCPYMAIDMINVFEESTQKTKMKANVDPNKCLSCGICVGSCQSDAIIYPSLQISDVKERIERWHNEGKLNSNKELTFVCQYSVGQQLDIDEQTGQCSQLPNHNLISVPCTGWINPDLLHELAKYKIKRINIVSCGSGIPQSRLGKKWIMGRIEGTHKPSIIANKMDGIEILHHEFNDSFLNEFLESLNLNSSHKSAQPKWKVVTVVMAIMLVSYLLIVLPSHLTYREKMTGNGQLVVSVKHAGAFIVEGTTPNLKKEEKKLRHMRRRNSARRKRSDIRLLIKVDGKARIEKSYPPSGIFKDGLSIATEKLNIAPGEHSIEVFISESNNSKNWDHHTIKNISFSQEEAKTVIFNKGKGFKWYQ